MRLPLRRRSAIALLFALSACGGGSGGGGGGGGLVLPGALAVVPPSEGGEPGGSAVRVADPALLALARADALLDGLGRVALDELVNEPAWLALVDAPGSAPGAPLERALWTVEAERAGDGPQDVRAWIPRLVVGGEALAYRLRASVARAPSPAAPFGTLHLDFVAFDPAGGVESAPLVRGALDTWRAGGRGGFTLWEARGDLLAVPAPGARAYEVQAAAERSNDGADGGARVFLRTRGDDGGGDTGIVPGEHLLAFDREVLRRSTDAGTPAVLARGDAVERAIRCGLFDAATGERVLPEPGLGFVTGGGAHGWLGPDGLWLPAGAVLAHGDEVRREAFGEGGEGTLYRVVRAPGRLWRLERSEVALDDVVGLELEWLDVDVAAGTAARRRVAWDGAAWLAVATRDEGTGAWVPEAPPEMLDTATLGHLAMECAPLGGLVAWVHGDAAVGVYAASTVRGDDPLFGAAASVDLFGFTRQLRPALTAAEVEAGDAFHPDAPDAASPRTYVLSRDDLTLREDVGTLEPVGLLPGETPAAGPLLEGLRSGPLVADPLPFATVHEPWHAAELFVWETGIRPWNRFDGLVGPGETWVGFAPAPRFAYRHATSADRNGDATYDGRLWILGLDAEGRLEGLPTEEVDLDGDGTPDRLWPVASLADGTPVGPTGVEYVVRALSVEQSLALDPLAAGPSLVPASDLVVPDASAFAAPELGDPPDVTDPPRVVGGAVVGGGP